MPINIQTYQNFQMVPIDETNSHLLKALVRHQAMHHKSKCVWDDGSDKKGFERLRNILDNQLNGTGGFFIFTPNHREPSAYVVHMPIISAQGKGLYMEDICVRPQCRHSGLGLFALSELANLAQNTGKEYISWVVARNNESGLNFYNRLESRLENTAPFFISGENIELANNDEFGMTRELTARDKILARKFCYQNGYDEKFLSFDDGHKMAASFDSRGAINAISLGGVNTSTFRAVQGIEVSEVLFSDELQQDLQQRRGVHRSLINCNIGLSLANNLSGHLIWGVDKNDRVLQSDLKNEFKAEVLTMTNDPASVLDRHYLGNDQISRIVRQHHHRCNLDTPHTNPNLYNLRLQTR